MSKKIEYKCNICTEIKPPIELLCVWYGWDSTLRCDQYIVVGNLDASDKHICVDCIKMIKEINISDFDKLSNTF